MDDKLKINNKDFLNYFIIKNPCNVSFIKSIRFNKKSISIKLNDDYKLIFDGFFTEKTLYGQIISYLRSYIKDKNINYTTDKDFLEYKFKNLIIN